MWKSPLLLATCLATMSCHGIIGLRGQIKSFDSRGGAGVAILPLPDAKHPTYAFAWSQDGRGQFRSVGFQRVEADGLVAFNLKLGVVYGIGVFTDENANRAYDAGEPAGILKEIHPASLADPDVPVEFKKLSLTRASRFPHGTRIMVPADDKLLGGVTNISMGMVAGLDDDRFDPKDESRGLWRPLDFLAEDHSGIYFAEPYDPGRIPVLLVHGIGGGPRDWKYVVEHLDRRRYQVWYAMYPSGMRLERIAAVMADGVRLLKSRHGFSRCHVVAHSMGGLVARRMVTLAAAAEGRDFIPRFATISTPWGGHDAATSGVRHLKHPVPSWIDVAPGSDYLLKLYATPLPRGTTHHMIYGAIADGPFYLKGENDGVVTVASETDWRIRARAASVKFLPYGHVPILSRPEALAEIEAHLAE